MDTLCYRNVLQLASRTSQKGWQLGFYLAVTFMFLYRIVAICAIWVIKWKSKNDDLWRNLMQTIFALFRKVIFEGALVPFYTQVTPSDSTFERAFKSMSSSRLLGQVRFGGGFFSSFWDRIWAEECEGVNPRRAEFVLGL